MLFVLQGRGCLLRKLSGSKRLEFGRGVVETRIVISRWCKSDCLPLSAFTDKSGAWGPCIPRSDIPAVTRVDYWAGSETMRRATDPAPGSWSEERHVASSEDMLRGCEGAGRDSRPNAESP